METITPSSIFNSIYLMVAFENHFVQIAPSRERPQIQRLVKFRC